MKILNVAIHNFRGIHDVSLDLSDYNLLVGPNNSGKSMVIDAFRAFYEKDKFQYKHERDFPFIHGGADKESWVELTFSLTDDEDSSLKDEYRQEEEKLRLRKYFKCADKKKDGYIFSYKTDGTLSDDSFYGAKNVQSGKIGDIVFIPAVSKVDEHTKLSGPSALRDLLTNVLQAVVASSPSYEKLCENFEMFAQGVKTEKTGDGRSLADLEADLSGLIESWGTTFQVEMRSPSVSEIIKTLLSPRYFDNVLSRAMEVDQFGSGFQRYIIFSLIQLGAKYIGAKPSKKTKDFTPTMMLILFEEPEAFLHPPQQEILAQNLMTLASYFDQQTICSTHSPHFVSRNAERITDITRLRRENGLVSTYQISDEAWEEMVDANQVINKIANRWGQLKARLEDDDLKPDMEAVKYILWLNPDRCGMFFANHVLIVEGTCEKALINKLLDEGTIKRPPGGLYVLDSIGKHNIHRFMNLLTQMGIPHSVIYDDDDGKDYHEELNQLIQESKSELTTALSPIAGDLETLLGIPKTAAHRKPQHVLYLLEAGNIAVKNLQMFCDVVAACLPQLPKS